MLRSEIHWMVQWNLTDVKGLHQEITRFEEIFGSLALILYNDPE